MIRVLRLMEYVYPDAETAEQDMARWTLQGPASAGWKSGMRFRSAVLPFEVLPDWSPDPAEAEAR